MTINYLNCLKSTSHKQLEQRLFPLKKLLIDYIKDKEFLEKIPTSDRLIAEKVLSIIKESEVELGNDAVQDAWVSYYTARLLHCSLSKKWWEPAKKDLKIALINLAKFFEAYIKTNPTNSDVVIAKKALSIIKESEVELGNDAVQDAWVSYYAVRLLQYRFKIIVLKPDSKKLKNKLKTLEKTVINYITETKASNNIITANRALNFVIQSENELNNWKVDQAWGSYNEAKLIYYEVINKAEYEARAATILFKEIAVLSDPEKKCVRRLIGKDAGNGDWALKSTKTDITNPENMLTKEKFIESERIVNHSYQEKFHNLGLAFKQLGILGFLAVIFVVFIVISLLFLPPNVTIEPFGEEAVSSLPTISERKPLNSVNGLFDIHVYVGSKAVESIVKIDAVNEPVSEITGFLKEVTPNIYTLTAVYNEEEKTQTHMIKADETILVNFNFEEIASALNKEVFNSLFWVTIGLFGAVGGSLSGIYNLKQAYSSKSDMPERILATWITIARPVIGFVAAIVISIFIIVGFVDLVNIGLTNYALFAMGFVSGFSERLIIGAVDQRLSS